MAPKATSTLEDARNPFLMVGLEDCFQVLINTLKYSQMLTNYLLYARSTIVMVWRTQGRAFVKVGWIYEEPRQKYKCSIYDNMLTLKPKANFYNNWVLPVEKDIPFSASCFEKETRPARFRGKFWGKETCQMSDLRNTSLWHKIFKQGEMPSNKLQVPTQFGIVFYFDSDDIPFLCD